MSARLRSYIRSCIAIGLALTAGVTVVEAQAVIATAAGAASTAGSPDTAAPVSKGGTGTKRAVLIGINDYKAVPQLMGSVNDVAAIRHILLTRWGFAPEDIVTLTDQEATRAAILSALRRIVRESGPDDTVFVHFSGHGSQVQDLNGDEADGLDETLVPYDGRTPGVPDIVDDELDQIFSELRAKAVLIVLDSCHSGTATRAVEFRVRGVPQDTRVDLYRQSAISTRAIVPRVQAQFLVMSSAAANQQALDGPIDGEYHGVFTHALTKTLSASAQGASPRDVFAGIEQELTRLRTKFGLASMPEPQLEGPPDQIDRPLLAARSVGVAGSAASRLAWIETLPSTAGHVTLINGALLGAAPGSTWSIYPPGETAFAPGRASAIATVVDYSGADARATVQPGTAQPQHGARAVMLMSGQGNQRVPVRIVDVPAGRRARIEELLRRAIRNVDVVSAGAPARFLIDAHENKLRLLTTDGRQVLGTFDAGSDQWATEVGRVISRSTNASELLALDNATSQLRVSARVEGANTQSTRDIVLVASTNPAQLHIRGPNEPRSAQNSLQIAVTVSSDAYLTIVDVDSEGNTNLLFPNAFQRSDFWPDGRIPGNRTLLFPDSLVGGARAGFFWDYGPPAGTDTIRIFASTDAATARLIRERVRALRAPQGGTRGLDDTARWADGFDGLRQDLVGLATRGITTVADPASGATASSVAEGPPDWSAVSLTVAISN